MNFHLNARMFPWALSGQWKLFKLESSGAYLLISGGHSDPRNGRVGSALGIRSNLRLEDRQRKATVLGSGCCETHPEGEKWDSCPLSRLEPSKGAMISLSSETIWEKRPIRRPGWKN